MSRRVMFWCTLSVAACLGVGCQEQAAETEMHSPEPSEPRTSLADLDAPAEYPADPYASPNGTAAPAAEPDEEVLAPTGQRTHTVRRGDTLYKLARQYYNDQSKWKTIYEANRSRLDNPNDLKVGQDLVIP